MRALIRRAAEQIGTRTGVTAVARRFQAHRVAVLAYHNVVPEQEAGRGDASLHLPLPRFIEQIERLNRTHRIVDLSTAASDAASAGGGRPLAVITFDDAYRGAVTLALPELTRRALPATVFVSPGLLGHRATWWDELGETGLLTPEVRTRALEACAGLGSVVRDRLLPTRGARVPATYGIATEAELRRFCKDGIALGSHAWDHPCLPSLSQAQLETSLGRTLDWLRGWGGQVRSWLALPYGANSKAVGRTALRLGHEGVLEIDGGLWSTTSSRDRVPRVNVPAGLTPRGLELRTSGILNR